MLTLIFRSLTQRRCHGPLHTLKISFTGTQTGFNSHLYWNPDDPILLSMIFVIVIFAMSAIARLPSTRVGELKADAVVEAGVRPEDSARELRNSSEQSVLKAE